ncbi:recombinase family protein [Kitasatospora sp. NPDC101235]|uniref:recombinase family protein n=1 Tax=Kitasatospora sp. NPDC101235 TaxID=3364101 RepID=UPI0038033B0A
MPELSYVDLYLRKSRIVRNEDPRDLTSIQAQEDSGRSWAAREGYRVRKVWVDNLSAWSDVERPEFDKALAAVLDGEVPALWCAYLDRFTRKGIDDIGPILGKARVIFDYDGLDSSNERDRRWIIDRAEQAREFSNRLSYNIKTTKASMRSRGQWTQAPPYGLEVDASKKLRHNSDWRYVLHVVESAALGFSHRSIAKGMNSGPAPIAGPGGGLWYPSVVGRIIHNPVYEGWQVAPCRKDGSGRFEAYRDQQGNRVRVFVDGAEPIPHELLVRARQNANGNRLLDPAVCVSTRETPHLLTDSVMCCGCRRTASVRGLSHVCWRGKDALACAEPLSVLRTALEDYVTEAWFTRLKATRPEDPLLVVAAQRWTGLRQSPEMATELADALAALKTAEAGVQRLVAQQASGFFDPPFDTHLPRLQHEARVALDSAKARVAEASPKQLDVSFLLEDERLRRAWDEADLGLRRELIRLAVRRVVVRKGKRGVHPFNGDDRVEIHWLDAPDPWVPQTELEDLAPAA